MGWYYQQHKPESIRTFFKKNWNHGVPTDSDIVFNVLDTALVARTEAYAAIERIDTDGSRMVFAAAYMVRFCPNAKDGYVFGYKPMTDDMGPNIYRCPVRILDILTPLDGSSSESAQWAIVWREQCRQVAEKKKVIKDKLRNASIGDIFMFDKSIKFTNGAETNQMTLNSKKPLRFSYGYSILRIRNLDLYNFKIIKAGNQ